MCKTWGVLKKEFSLFLKDQGAGGSNKTHQGGNYQGSLKWGGGAFRSFF